MVARTLTVVQMLPELESGGVERGTLELGAYLASHGHRSLVISQGGRMAPRLEEMGSTHLTWPWIGEKSPRSLLHLLPLRRLLLREKVDILHLRSRLPAWIGYLAWLSLPAKKRPCLVTTFHGFYSVNCYSAVMTKGERVIAVSRVISDHIRECYHLSPERLALIYRGVDLDSFNPETVGAERLHGLRQNWGLEKRFGPVIMLPGRITRLKGHDIFLQALAMIRELDWTAVCIGDPADNPALAEELQDLIQRLQLSGRVRFVGHCRDMPAAYMLSDLVVSATYGRPESFGRVAVEAQAMARPVIVSAHGGSLETVKDGETGWLVEPGGVSALAQAMQEALSDPAKSRRLGAQGRVWVRENFSIEKMCRQTVELYEEMLGER